MISPIAGGVTAPDGFRAAGVACGIKASGLDLALVCADGPASAAAIFTTNRAQAAPVLVSRDHVGRTGGRARAVVINSGCANACTGTEGLETARLMAAETARRVGCPVEQVLVASTGVIGVTLDRSKVARGIDEAAGALSRAGHDAAARAIITTDRGPKEYSIEMAMPAGTFRVGGIAKGAGMIEPQMATMLALLTTDAAVEPALLRRALTEAADDTFNAITVDGDTSTNDTLFVLAGGASGVTIDEAAYHSLVEALRAVSRQLAVEIVRGAEGATKLIAIRVTGAATSAEAKRAARIIANSLLVKTAVHGGDPNWGRLLAAAGRAGVGFELERAAVRVGDIMLFAGGRPYDDRAPRAADHLRGSEIEVEVDLGAGGHGAATIWTCDLSAEYVRINAEYRT
jgi:glutamate N-acetyltransferase/amino-acid N-acetyltransferase